MVTYPKDWITDKVSDVADISTGCRDTQDNDPNGRYPFFVRSPIVERIDTADYDCEAVLTAGDGVGTVKVFHYINGKFSAHQRVYVMNNFRGVDAEYFYYFFSKNFINEVEKYNAKSSVDSVRRAMIADMEFPHPALSEQKEIIGVLSAFNDHINDLNELIEKKKSIRCGALEDLMNGRIRLEGFAENWENVTLGEITDILNGDRGVNYPSEDDILKYGIPFINAGHLDSGKIDMTNMEYISSELYMLLGGVKLQRDDILFCLRGSLGKFAYVDFDGGAPASSLCVIRAKQDISARFIRFILETSTIKAAIEAANSGSSQPNLSAKDIKNFEFSMPSDIKEQEDIAGILIAMDEEISELQTKRDKMIQIRDGAMDDLLTGRIRLSV